MRGIRQGAAGAADLGRLSAVGLAAAGAAAVLAAPAAAVSLGEMAGQAAGDLETLRALLAILFYLIGAVLVGFGLLKLKRNADQPQQGTAGAGFVAILLGVALIVAPSVINAVTDTAGADSSQTLERPKL